MWPWLRDGLKSFFGDKTYFSSGWDRWVTKIRGLLMATGAAVAVYGDQLSASLPPAWGGKVKVGGILLMAVALMLRAGDKTPANIKALSTEIDAVKPGTPIVAPPPPPPPEVKP